MVTEMIRTTENQTKYPTHNVYILKEKEGQEKPDWIKVGAGWEHGNHDDMNNSPQHPGTGCSGHHSEE